MAIKGQNLRLFIGDKCVAAATNCSLNVSANLQDATTKDSGEWAESICTGVSWEASVEALVTEGWNPQRNLPTEGWASPKLIDDEPYFYGSTGFSMIVPANQTLVVEGFTQNGYGFAILNTNGTAVLAENTTGAGTTTYTSGATGTNVKIAWRHGEPTGNAWVRFGLENDAKYAEDAVDAISNGQRVRVKFATTNGAKNRVEDEVLKEGYAYIQNLQITAQVNNLSTYTCNLVGDGELETPEDE